MYIYYSRDVDAAQDHSKVKIKNATTFKLINAKLKGHQGMKVSQDKMKNNLWHQKNYTNDRNSINNNT